MLIVSMRERGFLLSRLSSADETGYGVLDSDSSFYIASCDEVFGESSAFPAPEFWSVASETIQYFHFEHELFLLRIGVWCERRYGREMVGNTSGYHVYGGLDK